MSTEIILTFAVLGITILLFVKEWLRVDVVALCVMLALPWLGLVEPHEALAGLSSNAVFSIIGVMILGCGVDRSGIMAKVTRPILRVAGSSERRLVSLPPSCRTSARRHSSSLPCSASPNARDCPSRACSCRSHSPPSSAAP
jgi:di/tricarboxylate transporter